MKKLSTIPRTKCMFVAALLFSLMSATSFAQSVLFRDDFNGSMQSGWTWTRENPATWSLTATGLQIELEYGDLWQGWTNNCRNMLLRPAPSGDFIIEAKLDVSLVAPINQAHILLYYNDDYYVRFGPVLSYGYQVVIDVVHEVGGGIAHQSAVSWGNNLVYLKIEKTGSSASCYYGSDGQNWTLHRTVSNLNFTTNSVGLVAFDGSEPPSSSVATYDYFQLSELPPPECISPPSGLVSWWPGDGNANDIQGSNHGTLQNGATFAAGKVGQAFSFDGVNDYISIPHNSALQPTQITVSVWIKANPVQSYSHYLVVDKSHGWVDATGWVLQGESSTGKIAFSYGNGVDFPEFYSNSNLLDNNWHFVAGTLDGSDLKIYIDGALEGSLPYSGTPTGSSRNVNIGASWGGGTFNRFFNGLIDEVDIYDRALSVSEIQSLYNAGSAGKCQPPPPSCVNPPSGLVSWWPGEDNANDIQSSNHGMLQNGATFAAGKVGQAFSFDGVDDVVKISSVADIEVQQFTIDAWVLAESPGFRNDVLGGVIVTKDIGDTYTAPFASWSLVGPGNTNKYHINIGFTDGSFHFLPSTNSFPFNTFNHVAATWDGNTLMLYVNAQVEGTLNLGPRTVAYSGEALTIGEHNIFPAARRGFDGLIDEVTFYNRALSASEIQSIYNASSAGKCINIPPSVCFNPPSGLISWWPGDENSNDIVGGNHGTLQNGATFGPGVVEQAFSLDGVDDFVSINTFNALDGLSDATFEFWIKMSTFPSDPNCNSGSCGIVLFSKNDFVFAIGIHSTLAIEVSRGNGSNWGGDFTLSNGALTGLNQWNHVAVVIDGITDKIYINGVLNTTNTQVENSFANFGGLVFGSGFSGDYIFLDAELDEITIYKRALSAAEIAAIYNATSAGKCKECTPPDVSITGNEPVCPNTTHTYTANTDAANPTFEWSVTGGTINGSNTGSSVSVTAGGAGTMAVSLEVTDGATNCSNSATQEITVEDTQAPVITAATNPITLWPPNHQYVTINVSQCVTAVTDNCATLSPSDVVITKVTSDEPEDAKGGGDGNTLNDMAIAAGCQSVQLRSERQGSGNGRVYTVYLSVSDGNGNTGTATCQVTVPKSQNGNPAVDDGPVYTVTGNCGGSAGKIAGASSVETAEAPEGYALAQNYPNPFNPGTMISFALPEAGEVTVRIYSETGQLVKQVANGKFASGRYQVSWDGRNESGQAVAAGVYLYRLLVRGENGAPVFTETKRMTLVK